MAFDRRGNQVITNGASEMSQHGEPFVSIIIPAYNEAHRLEASITTLQGYLSTVPWSHEVILVIEKSNDGTLDLAQKLAERCGIQVIGNDVQRGKGYAVRTGMHRARGEFAFFMDADLSTPLAHMDLFLARFASSREADVIVGNRQHRLSRIVMRQGLIRRTMGQTFNFILRTITGIRLADTQCGFKAFRRAARESIFMLQKIDGFAFDVEVLLLAESVGLVVEDMPVEWCNAAGSKVRIIRDSFKMLRDAIRVRRLASNAVANRRVAS